MSTAGPAFPQPNHVIDTDRGREEARGWMADSGMTLLDWFAGQALAAMVEAESKESHKQLTNDGYEKHEATHFTRGFLDEDYWEGAAKASYACASAMLAEKALREATGKDSLQVEDYFRGVTEMTKLEARNRELVEALSAMEMWVPTHCENQVVAAARAVLAKAKETKP